MAKSVFDLEHRRLAGRPGHRRLGRVAGRPGLAEKSLRLAEHLLDHSFRLGDRIISCGYDGTIEDIGFRSTKIRTAAGHLVTIPNSSMVNSTIENVSRRPAVRRVITLQIAGRTPIEKLRQAMKALGGIFDEEGIRGPVRPMIDGAASAPQVRFEDIQRVGFQADA